MANDPGYKGWVAVQVMGAASLAAPSGLAMPITGAEFAMNPDIQTPEVLGATSPMHFAEVARRNQGSFRGPLMFGGSGASIYHAIMNLGLVERYGGNLGTSYLTDDAQPSLAYAPKAIWLHQYEESSKIQAFYRFLCRTLTIRGSAGGVVEFSVDGQAYARHMVTASANNLFSNPTTTANAPYTPIPFWNTALEMQIDGSTWVPFAVTAWEITIGNNTIETFASSPTVATANTAVDVHRLNQGVISVSGSFTLATAQSLSDPGGSNFRRFRVVLGASQGSGGSPPAKTIVMPNCVISSYAVPLPGVNQRIMRTYQFRSLGDGTNEAAYIANYA